MALDDPMTGAQFARQVGADPKKWAAEFLRAYTSESLRTDADRQAFVEAWCRDAMEAAVKAAGE
jgi:hypothetical protein